MDELKYRIKRRDLLALSDYKEYLRCHPKLTYLFIELTDSCNLACVHCGSNCAAGKKDYIDTDITIKSLRTIAADFDPSRIMVCLTGGEPLLHKDFFVIAEEASALGFPIGITTNGTMIDNQTAVLMKKVGFQSATVSLDGTEEFHDIFRRKKGCYQETIRGIKFLKDNDIRVQVTTVVSKLNCGQLDDLYSHMQNLEIDSWRLTNIEPIGRALVNGKSLMLSKEELIHLLDFIREKRFSGGTPMDVSFGCSHYLSFQYEREVRDNYFICGSGVYVGSILVNGDIYSCLDIQRRPELVQGNIKKDRFSNVWYTKFDDFRIDRTLLSDKCSKCPERIFCGGDSTHTWDFDKNAPMMCIFNWEFYENFQKERCERYECRQIY